MHDPADAADPEHGKKLRYAPFESVNVYNMCERAVTEGKIECQSVVQSITVGVNIVHSDEEGFYIGLSTCKLNMIIRYCSIFDTAVRSKSRALQYNMRNQMRTMFMDTPEFERITEKELITDI